MFRTVLHVGCGGKTLADLPQGFRDGTWREVRLDIEPGCKPDIVGTLTDMSAAETASFDSVFSSHNIEHVFFHEVSKALSEFGRVLKPNGFAVITCPDLQLVGRRLAEGKLLDKIYDSPAGPVSAFDIIFGHRASVARGEPYMAHRGGFTSQTLADALGLSPLKARLVRRCGMNLWALAFKEPKTAEALGAVAHEFLPA